MSKMRIAARIHVRSCARRVAFVLYHSSVLHEECSIADCDQVASHFFGIGFIARDSGDLYHPRASLRSQECIRTLHACRYLHVRMRASYYRVHINYAYIHLAAADTCRGPPCILASMT